MESNDHFEVSLDNFLNMGKPKVSAKSCVKEFPGTGLEDHGGKLWCTICSAEINFERKSTISNHLKSAGHLQKQSRKSLCTFENTLLNVSTYNNFLLKVHRPVQQGFS